MSGVTAHVLRHTAATLMARSGVPLWHIAGELGNSVAMIENVYAKHCPDAQRTAIDTISSTVWATPRLRASYASDGPDETTYDHKRESSVSSDV